MREDLIKYLTKLVDIQEKVYWLKWDDSDLKLFCTLLSIDNSTRREPNFSYWESVIDLIHNKK